MKRFNCQISCETSRWMNMEAAQQTKKTTKRLTAWTQRMRMKRRQRRLMTIWICWCLVKCQISVGGKEKCTKLQSNKDARGGKADFSLCFDEWKYFSIQIPEQNSRAVNLNQIMVELLLFEPVARDPKPMGSAFFNVLKVLSESIVTHQFNVMLNKQVVCKLDVEMAITYGSFGYGHSHQVKHPEKTVGEQVEKSLFPRCPSPDNLQDPDYKEKNTQSDIISYLIQRESQGGRDSSDLMKQIEKRGRLRKLYKILEECEAKQNVVQFLEKLVMRQEPESPWTTNNLESENQPNTSASSVL